MKPSDKVTPTPSGQPIDAHGQFDSKQQEPSRGSDAFVPDEELANGFLTREDIAASLICDAGTCDCVRGGTDDDDFVLGDEGDSMVFPSDPANEDVFPFGEVNKDSAI